MGNKPSTSRPTNTQPQYHAPQPQQTYQYPAVHPGPVPAERNPYYTPTGPFFGGYVQYPHQPGTYGQPPPPYPYAPYPPAGPPQPQPNVPVTGTTTKTIQNPVNLKKTSLRLEPMPGNPRLLVLKFSFDASAPCRVSTFLCATEDRSNSLRLFNHLHPLPPLESYSKGMGLQFPPPNTDPARHTIDVGTLNPNQLLNQAGDTYPLVIRLEALTEAAQRNNHTLEALPPGSPLPSWMQAQTTYAKLSLEQDGKWEVRVVKQTIWVEGVVYDLQEIYGLVPSKEAEPDNANDDGLDCVICMSERRNTMVLPCRHLCLCTDCANALRTQTHKCPICRIDIQSMLTLSNQGKEGGPAGVKA